MFGTARAEYACLAMVELARKHAQAGTGKPVPVGDLAGWHAMPQQFLVQILLQLKSAGLVSITRGAQGGYCLARPPGEITLAEILGALDRPKAEDAVESTPAAMSLRRVWRSVTEAREQVLADTTLADLVAGEGPGDYVI